MTPLAAHEAGHVVALAYFGWTIREATVIPNGRCAGLVTHSGPPAHAAVFEDFAIASSGLAAEQRLLGREPDGHSAVNDFAEARQRLNAALPDPPTRYAAQTRATFLARHIVALHWSLITRVAAELERHQRLSGAQILDIVRQHAAEKEKTR